MEQEKRGRGRPKIFTGPLDEYAPSRRQAMNAMYMYEGVEFISVAATEIPDSHLIWVKDDVARTSSGRQGIVEQIGRMVVQDRFGRDDCIYVATLAAAAVKALEGYLAEKLPGGDRPGALTSFCIFQSTEGTAVTYMYDEIDAQTGATVTKNNQATLTMVEGYMDDQIEAAAALKTFVSGRI